MKIFYITFDVIALLDLRNDMQMTGGLVLRTIDDDWVLGLGPIGHDGSIILRLTPRNLLAEGVDDVPILELKLLFRQLVGINEKPRFICLFHLPWFSEFINGQVVTKIFLTSGFSYFLSK
ncbi:hypothetical protein ACJX0J_040291, partial [Zea mays]